jgi:predicted MFS family arabinose efflux permease
MTRGNSAQRDDMSGLSRVSIFTPFEVRSYRFQWPADLLISCAMEMELPILGWYILNETQSVLLLAIFGGLQYIGTLISPMMGVIGDRIGCRNLLLYMRISYTLNAAAILILASLGRLDPFAALIISGLGGILRPSDGMVRNTLIAQTVPEAYLMVAIGISRVTQDIARILGAILGTGLVTIFGFEPAYEIISLIYLVGTALTLGAQHIQSSHNRSSHLKDMWEGLVYVWNTPLLLAAFWIAFLVNLTAYPFTLGLLPHVAKDIYHIDQSGLGLLVASFSVGGLIGSITLSFFNQTFKSGWSIIYGSIFWFLFLLAFGQTDTLLTGTIFLCIAGFAQNICTVPMFVVMLKVAAPDYRGRVMGVRMLAIYGLPVGLMITGRLIEYTGFRLANFLMVLTGLVLLGLITIVYKKQLLDSSSGANQI